MSARCDGVTLEVLRHKLVGIAEEMQLTLIRSAFSIIVKEGKDASASLFTLQGETLAQANAVPIHLGALIPIVRHLVAAFPPATMKEGDAFVINDPYLGGTHTPDIAVMMPVFVAGRPIAISTTMTHHQDIGGMAPGSTPTNATEIFQEGLRIPLLKLLDAGRRNETLMEILRRNSRLPEILAGDLNAQIASCLTGVDRLRRVAASYGAEHIGPIFADLLDRSEIMTRAALRELPDGDYEYEDFLDNDGVDLDKPIRIAISVRLRDGSMHCDFAGSSPQVRGPLNCMPSGPLAAGCFALRAVTDPLDDIPNNGGCFRPLSFDLPVGSVVNPVEPAAVGCRSATVRRVAGVILGALRQAAPDRVPADTSGNSLLMHFGGRYPSGSSFIASQAVVGGAGAAHCCDGVDVIDTDVVNGLNPPIESLEMSSPIRTIYASLNPDSGGAGRFRGGLGARYEFEVLGDGITLTYRGERHQFAARGAAGGRSGAKAIGVIRRGDGTVDAIPSKAVTTLNTGDRLTIATAGGGGYGPPHERDRSAIVADLADGKITPDSARHDYGHDEPIRIQEETP